MSINEKTIIAESKNEEKEILLDLDIPTILMDDTESKQNLGIDPSSESKPTRAINRINDLTTGTSDTFDLLGDLNSEFTLQSTKVNAEKKCNTNFDPFDFQSNLTQVDIIQIRLASSSFPYKYQCIYLITIQHFQFAVFKMCSFFVYRILCSPQLEEHRKILSGRIVMSVIYLV